MSESLSQKANKIWSYFPFYKGCCYDVSHIKGSIIFSLWPLKLYYLCRYSMCLYDHEYEDCMSICNIILDDIIYAISLI